MLVPLLFSFAAAQIDSDQVSIAINDSLSGQSIASAIILIVVGLISTFFGYKLFRPTLFVAGFLLFTMLGYTLLIRVEPSQGYNDRANVLLFGSLAIGLAGGFLSLYLYRLGTSIVGALGGASLAMFILTFNTNMIQNETSRAIFIAAFALVGAILVHFLEKPIIIFGSSFGGSYSVFTGVDFFAKTGYAINIRRILQGNSGIVLNVDAAKSNAPLYGMLVGALVLGIVGVFVQYRMNSNKQRFRDAEK